MKSETICVIEDMIKLRRQQLESCNRMMELLEPEWKIFETRDGHSNSLGDLYIAREYTNNSAAAKKHRVEIAALEDMLAHYRSQVSGQWELITREERVCLQSEDFTHDARLYVNGDFRDRDQEIAFAEGVLSALNRGGCDEN